MSRSLRGLRAMACNVDHKCLLPNYSELKMMPFVELDLDFDARSEGIAKFSGWMEDYAYFKGP